LGRGKGEMTKEQKSGTVRTEGCWGPVEGNGKKKPGTGRLEEDYQGPSANQEKIAADPVGVFGRPIRGGGVVSRWLMIRQDERDTRWKSSWQTKGGRVKDVHMRRARISSGEVKYTLWRRSVISGPGRGSPRCGDVCKAWPRDKRRGRGN